jgi:hypothetical protein
LTERDNVAVATLPALVQEDKSIIESILTDLISEGLLVQRRGRVSLAE